MDGGGALAAGGLVLCDRRRGRGVRGTASERPSLWFESRRALISGDTLADFGGGIQIHDEWLWGVTREEVVDALRPLLALPVELVLPAHGAPTDRAALERALS